MNANEEPTPTGTAGEESSGAEEARPGVDATSRKVAEGAQVDDSTDGENGSGSPGTAAKRRRRGRRGGKRHRRPASAAARSGETPDEAEPPGGVAESEPPADSGSKELSNGEAEPAKKAAAPRARSRPRGSRGGRGRGPTTRPAAEPPEETPAPGVESGGGATEAGTLTQAEASAEDRADALAGIAGAESAEEAGQPAGDGAAAQRPRRRRGGRGRGGSRTTAAAATPEPGEEGSADEQAAPSDAKPAKRASTRAVKAPAAKVAKSAAKGTGQKAAPRGSTRLAARDQRRQQRKPYQRRRLTEEEAKALRGESKTMLVHTGHDRIQIAVLEQRELIEHYVARETTTTLVGNIYLGRVQNVIAGMEAAFVDLGQGRNAVLYAGEVNYAAEDLEDDVLPRIEQVLHSGQPVLVQVTKDPIGTKGARLTAQISLPGRYLVLAPDQKLTGISRRLHENERTRLRQALTDIRPDGHGVIVRTAAEGASREALKRDLDHLVKQWEEIKRKQKHAKAPALLGAEPELVMRVVRDIFSGDFEKVVVDGREMFEKLREYLEGEAPELLEKLELYEGPLPLFEGHHVTEQIHKALERKVWLPSGGSIVIDRTEAMTVIDVNTGKFIGKGGSLEDTVYKNNLEAAEEIGRHLRLRDIGGIILIDFIDMLSLQNRNDVLRTLKRSLARDKTRSQVSDEVSKLGLVEMTRKRSSEGLLEAFSETCPQCDGRGIVITHEID